MNFLKFKYHFWRLKRQYKKFLKAKDKYNSKSIEKKKFVSFFIRDEEDKFLNKKVLDGFNKQIQKYKLKIYKRENKINKILFSLGIIDLNYIDIFYKFGISESDSQIIKEIFKNRINS
jgi:hypothetical protein